MRKTSNANAIGKHNLPPSAKTTDAGNHNHQCTTHLEVRKKFWQEFGKSLGKVVGKIEKDEKDILARTTYLRICRETPFCTQTSRNNHTSLF
jgi:hypothetical protein